MGAVVLQLCCSCVAVVLQRMSHESDVCPRLFVCRTEMCVIPYSCMRHDTHLSVCRTFMCVITHSYMWYDIQRNVCHDTHSHLRYEFIYEVNDCTTYREMCVITHSYMNELIHM